MANAELPEIVGWFIPRTAPVYFGPEDIVRGWVGVPMPIREDSAFGIPEMGVGYDVLDMAGVQDTVTIAAVDALKSLRVFGRGETAGWWKGYFDGFSSDSSPEGFKFEVKEQDQILADEAMCMILPGIENFDQTEV